jgi:hypothetical protein
VAGLAASPCAGSLREVVLRPYIGPAAAHMLLSKLPRLQNLEMHVDTSDEETFQLSSYAATQPACWTSSSALARPSQVQLPWWHHPVLAP